jgi:NitT/TauT family transport system ATP-binding protein
MAAVVEIKSLAIAYGDAQVLADFTVQLEKGSFTAVVGPSGVGKSTLLRVIAGLIPPSGGEILAPVASDPHRRPFSLVFQEARLLPWRRVLGNIQFGLEGLHVSRDERRERAHNTLSLVRLNKLADRWPHQLSGGEKQRVNLARALAVRPDLLLLDEPFSALDAITRHTLQDELLRLWQETGVSILFVTHDLDEAVTLADRVVVLGGRPARVIRELDVELARPRRSDTAGFTDTVRILRGALNEAHTDGERK